MHDADWRRRDDNVNDDVTMTTPTATATTDDDDVNDAAADTTDDDAAATHGGAPRRQLPANAPSPAHPPPSPDETSERENRRPRHGDTVVAFSVVTGDSSGATFWPAVEPTGAVAGRAAAAVAAAVAADFCSCSLIGRMMR